MGSFKLDIQDVQKMMSDQGRATREEAVKIILGLESQGFEAVYVGDPARGYYPHTLMTTPSFSLKALKAPEPWHAKMCQWSLPGHMLADYHSHQLQYLKNWNWTTV